MPPLVLMVKQNPASLLPLAPAPVIVTPEITASALSRAAIRLIPLAVDAADSVRFTDEGDEPHGGDHGFSLNEPQSRVIFLLSGAAKYAFKSFDSCSVVDIAPTLSRLFSLSMPDTDGKNLLL